jgi:probable rRNA maturation factor
MQPLTPLADTPATPSFNLEVLVENTATRDAAIDMAAPLVSVPWQSWFSHWLSALQPDWSPINAYELSLRLTDDGEIQQLNASYRHQDRPTDVLAFAALETMVPSDHQVRQQIPTYLGDIIISVETAEQQRREFGHSLKQEVVWLAAHGFLHLLGWDHPDDPSLESMLIKQKELLSWVDWA